MQFFIFFIIFSLFLQPIFAQNKAKIDSLQTVLKNIKNDTLSIQTEVNLARELRKTKAGQELLRSAIQKSEELGYVKGIALAYLVQGISYRDSSLYGKAIEVLEKTIEIAKNLPEKNTLAEAYNDIGSVYRRMDEYEKSLDYYLKALQTAETYKDESNYGKALNGVGNNYRQLKQFKEAIKYFEKALEYERKRGNLFGVSVNLNNLGKVYFDLQENEKSLSFMLAALKMNEEAKNLRGATSCLNTIGEIYRRRKEYNKAQTTLERAVKTDEELGDRRYLIDSYINLGELHGELGNNELGISYIEKALKLAFDIKTKSKIQSGYEHLYDLYKKTGDYKKALSMYEQAILFKDSILNEKNQESIAKIQSKFETESQKIKIALLEKDKAIQATEASKRINLMLGLVVFFFLVAIAFFINYNIKKKANDQLQAQNKLIQTQSIEIANINENLTSSINYAKRIQFAMLPYREKIIKFLPEKFIFFRPRDIVSGDFYWFHQIDSHKAMIACVDCTGHGVPGAFMSMLGQALLSKIVENEKVYQPNLVLNELHKEIIGSLQQTEGENRDGMDITVCLIDKASQNLYFSGACNPLIYIQNGTLHEIKGDRLPIGGIQLEENRSYTQHTVSFDKPTMFYTFTDGYQDQFGGENGKKFMIKRMRTLFLDICQQTMPEQKQAIDQNLTSWQGKEAQIDDILVMGFRL
jgi:tetratricopeptide (TPR) repeat protein